ncbi:hypothetical protein [Actinotalea subterranea]|uniref:hypothetical protein n=1 Tax=Actinotalea subterranea TaxID=2607497 RepID=UPI0011EBF34A|nr:hypothetical protein [Actinotalea subterranea]
MAKPSERLARAMSFTPAIKDTSAVLSTAQTLDAAAADLRRIAGDLGMTGISADAGWEEFVAVAKDLNTRADEFTKAAKVAEKAEAAVERAQQAYADLPSGDLEPWQKVAIAGGGMVVAGPAGAVTGAVAAEIWGNEREKEREAAAQKALAALEQDLQSAATAMPTPASSRVTHRGRDGDDAGDDAGSDGTTPPDGTRPPVYPMPSPNPWNPDGPSVITGPHEMGDLISLDPVATDNPTWNHPDVDTPTTPDWTNVAIDPNPWTPGDGNADGDVTGTVPGGSGNGTGGAGTGVGGSGYGAGYGGAGGALAGGVGIGGAALGAAALGRGMRGILGGAGSGSAGGVGGGAGAGSGGRGGTGLGAGSLGSSAGRSGTAGAGLGAGARTGSGLGGTTSGQSGLVAGSSTTGAANGSAAGGRATGMAGGMGGGGGAAGGSSKSRRGSGGGYLAPDVDIDDEPGTTALGAGARAGSRGQARVEAAPVEIDDESW